ncbi:MAG: glycine zipper family protein [Alphaproteobacteria bacterium]
MKPVIAATAAILIAGCANSYRPIVDSKGTDMSNYEQDLTECRSYASQVSPAGTAAGGAVLGAAAGGALGAVGGAFSGHPGFGAARGAALGGTGGLLAGGYKGAQDQTHIVRNCMRGRGYRVLD